MAVFSVGVFYSPCMLQTIHYEGSISLKGKDYKNKNKDLEEFRRKKYPPF
jgi:hypothetical protein